MSTKQASRIFTIVILLVCVITYVVLYVYVKPTIEKVFNEAANAPNPRVQEALSEPAVLAGLYALDGQTGQVQWTAQLKGISFSGPAVAGDRVFLDIHTGNQQGILADSVDAKSKFVAIEAETGHEVWHTYNHGSHNFEVVVKYPPIATPDIMIDDTGYTLGVYEADTGKRLYEIEDVIDWSHNPDDVLPVALTEDRLIVRHDSTNYGEITDAVQAYDLHSGDLLWYRGHEPYPKEHDNDAVHLAPILADNQRVFLEVVDQFQAFDIDSGDFLFALDRTCTQAKIQGSILYCVNGDLKAFDAATGDSLWSFDPDIDLQEVEAVEDTIYVTTTPAERRQFLIAVNPADGSERWRVRVWDSALSADEETVFAIQVIKRQKALVALSATDGTQLWQFPLYSDDRHIPVSDGEKVYIVDIANR